MSIFDLFKGNRKSENHSDLYKMISDNIEDLLKRASTEPGLRPHFYKSLLDSELIVLTNKLIEEHGIKITDKDTTLSIFAFEDGKIPVFTSTDRIFDRGIIKDKVSFYGMNGKALFEMTKGSILLLNPYSDYGKELLVAEIDNLLTGKMFKPDAVEKIKKSSKIRLGQPAEFPTEMVQSIKAYCSKRDEIELAYIAMMHRPETKEPPHLLVALKLNNNEEQILGEISQAVRPHIKDGDFVDFMPLSIDKSGTSGYFYTIDPIYEKN
jgi:hypothetical protein